MPETKTPTLVAIDFETSGYAATSACAIGLARIENGQVVARYYTLLRPPSSRILFTEIHGLTWNMLRTAPTFLDAWEQFSPLWDGAQGFVAHNAGFDRRVLLACCKAANLPTPHMPFFCTLKGARRHLPLASKKLSSLCEYFTIPLQHHHAGSDAEACAEVYLHLRALGVHDSAMRL